MPRRQRSAELRDFVLQIFVDFLDRLQASVLTELAELAGADADRKPSSSCDHRPASLGLGAEDAKLVPKSATGGGPAIGGRPAA
eukprot:CAMPEP_0204075792 /NCGR_PEP_ID=MMETSP0360-20130528/166864_1 /ASSEMBLY_ACC=CAM_ASM_000342 /TAXON_ID=268821 /ORGANISM="Scrippsiella Hangoei, Strain SHTV-5" /LENGTH=83 /DNA_ID=CAMNT_0051024309 /DNA_START=590 /DNA_END=838 /DNA_ORIENTATION=+